MNHSTSKYLLDANVFIEAYRNYYSFDICPGFWECLVYYNTCANLFSIDRIRDELESGDKLWQWIKSRTPKTMFFNTNDYGVIQYYTEMIQWVQDSVQFNLEAKAEFAQVADGWLVAYAKQNNFIVCYPGSISFRGEEKSTYP